MSSWPISVVLLLAVCSAISGFNLGKPHCRMPHEFGRGWSVKNDESHYWECITFASAALYDCEPGTTFNEQYLMCTVPGAVLGEIDIPSPLDCGPGRAVDLSGAAPECIDFDCADGTVIYNPEGKPVCRREEPEPITLCPGASAAQGIRGTKTCAMPACTQLEFNANRLWASRNPHEFYRCSNLGALATTTCPPGTCFSDQMQTCVFAAEWVNSCA